MNSTGTPEKVNAPDTEVEWYDFGGGYSIAPTTTIQGNKLPGIKTDAPNMAVLYCVRNGLFYFEIYEGTFTTEDLPRMLEELSPAFKDNLPEKTQ